MQDALKVDFVQEIIAKCISWVKFCRITIGRAILKHHQQEQNVNEKQLILCVKTRWNSIYHMLQQFWEQKITLLSIELERQQINSGIRFAPKRPRMQVMNTIPTDLPQITQLDFGLLKKICPIFKIFEIGTLKFSHEQSTASTIIPTLKKLENFYNLSGVIGKRLKNLNDNKLLQMATLIHVLHIRKNDIWKPKSPAAISLPSTLSGEDTLLKRLQIQLSAFRSIDRPQASCNVFDWWKNNLTQFPDLSKFVRIFLSIPATSISSERLFSKAGRLYSNTLRNRLSAEMAENILIVKANMDKIFLAPSMDVDYEDIPSDLDLSDDEFQK